MDAKRLRQLMSDKGITIYRLSHMTGIRDGVLGRLVNEKTRDPRISTVIKIADALNIDINELIAKNMQMKKVEMTSTIKIRRYKEI